LKGSYVYGTKKLVMMSERHRRGDVVLTFVCEWDHGDDDRADCHIVEEVCTVATYGVIPPD